MQKNREEDQPNPNQTPNLLDPSLNTEISNTQRFSSFLPIVTGTILILNLSLVSLIIWHLAQNNHITNLRDMLNISYQKFRPEEKSWIQIEKITGKIAKYKEVNSEKEPVAQFMDVVLKGLLPEIQLQTLAYKDKEISMEFKANSVLSFTKMIDSYLKDKNVARIELRAASLNTSENIFTIEAGVIFK